MAKYETVIGLETHAQIKTRSKMFCSCPNRYGAEPNTLTCPVCAGHPGVLPTPNREAVKKTVLAGMLLRCDIARFSKFDRKSYFYPDMPKNYQISQYDLPFCGKGKVRIGGKGFSGASLPDREIGVTRVHLEEDVAKSTHFTRGSGVDFNRAGVPLMEIVSEPDMRSADDAYAYLTALKELIRFADIGDCDMEKGQLRCDVNISLRPVGAAKFGVKVELKNLNSFRAVHRAIEYEVERQAEILDAGGTITQQTRGWDDDRGETYLMREKESAHDYRYFPEPDLLPMTFSEELLDAWRRELPETPDAKRARFETAYGLTAYDAEVLTQDKALADFFDAGATKTKSPKLLANWIISELLRELSAAGATLAECRVAPEQLAALVELIQSGAINGKIAKTVFSEMFAGGKDPDVIVREKGLVQVTDASAIGEFVDQAIADNPAQVEEYKSGKKQVLQFFVGQVMKHSKGKANPKMVMDLLKSKLGD